MAATSTPKLPHSPGWIFVPNVFVRSAIFRSRLPGEKREISNWLVPITSLSNYRITQYDGELLDQGDLDVLLALTSIIGEMEASELSRPDDLVSIDLRPLLFACGRKDGGQNRKALLADLNRLATARFTIHFRDFAEADLSGDAWPLMTLEDQGTKSVGIQFSEEYRSLLEMERTGICREERQKLTSDGKWLHAFFSSHKLPLPLTPIQIAKLLGRSTKKALSFEPALIRQLEQLSKITGWKCEMRMGKTSIKKTGKGKGFTTYPAQSCLVETSNESETLEDDDI